MLWYPSAIAIVSRPVEIHPGPSPPLPALAPAPAKFREPGANTADTACRMRSGPHPGPHRPGIDPPRQPSRLSLGMKSWSPHHTCMEDEPDVEVLTGNALEISITVRIAEATSSGWS